MNRGREGDSSDTRSDTAAEDGAALEPDHVYIIPPDATLTVQRARLRLAQPAPPRAERRPIDTFFESLAQDQGENAAGIVLSSTGSDGTRGVKAIKACGGLTLAQAESDHRPTRNWPRSRPRHARRPRNTSRSTRSYRPSTPS